MDRNIMAARLYETKQYKKLRRTRLEKACILIQKILLGITIPICLWAAFLTKADIPAQRIGIAGARVIGILFLSAIPQAILMLIRGIPASRRRLWDTMHKMPSAYRQEKYLRQQGLRPDAPGPRDMPEKAQVTVLDKNGNRLL